MPDKKLKSFKISDKQKPSVRSKTKKSASEEEVSAARQTVGFTRIEGILDADTHGEVRQHLELLVDKLNDFAANSSKQKDKLAATKGGQAIHHTLDLLQYLFETKASMTSNLKQSTKGV